MFSSTWTVNKDVQGGSKSKLLILIEYVNKTEKIGGMWTNKNSYRKKMKHRLIYSREIFYVTIVSCLNILWLKTITEITARQTRTSLCKLDVIKVWSMAYLTTQIELVLPTFFQILDRSQNYTEYLTLGLLSSRWNIYRSTTVYFFWPTLYVLIHPTPDSPTLKMAGSQSVSHHLFCLLEPVRTGSVTKGRFPLIPGV